MTSKFTFLVIAIGLLLFSAATAVIAVFIPANATLYALFAGITGNFSGALFTLLHVSPATTTTTVTGNPPKLETETKPS